MIVDHWILINKKTNEVIMEGSYKDCLREAKVDNVSDLPSNLQLERPRHMSLTSQEYYLKNEE